MKRKALALLLAIIVLLFPLVLAVVDVKAEENSWITLAPMPTPRSGFGLAVVEDKIFAIGGYKDGEYLGINEMYNPETDTWINKAEMPTPRSGFAIAVVENKIHAIGGATGVFSSTSVHEIYDPVTDTWTSRGNSPLYFRSGITANVVDNKIYVISGGTTPARPWINTNENNVYDPETNNWTTVAPIPTAVFDYGSATLDNKIYIFGGRSIPDDITYSLTQIYDPQTDTWSLGASVPVALSGSGVASTTGVQAPKRVYLFNGYKCEGDGGFYYSEDVYVTLVYDPKLDTWDSTAEVLDSRCSVVASNDIIYAFYGYNGENYTSFSAKYLPLGYSNSDPFSTPSPEPTQTPMPHETPEPIEQEVILGLVFMVAIIGGSLVLFVYLIKRKQQLARENECESE